MIEMRTMFVSKTKIYICDGHEGYRSSRAYVAAWASACAYVHIIRQE